MNNPTPPKIIALLPMKAHSERVKGKNFKHLAGKPLFRWILDTLLSIDEIHKVIINTDARQILADNNLLDSERILIIDRKPELCGDMVSMNLILADDINHVPADIYLMTHTTNPLLSADTIRQAIQQYKIAFAEKSADSLFTVNKIQTRFYKQDGSTVNHDPNQLIRTQDLEPWFEENSNLYIFNKKSFEKNLARIGKKPILFTTPKSESIDIDDSDDWDIAKALLEKQSKET